MAPPSLQEDIEANPVGRALISVAIVFTILGFIFNNIPDSALKTRAGSITRPFINSVGLDQNWGVFAPNPRSQVLQLHARITYDDGESVIWQLPECDPVIGHYRFYRWQKWMEYVRQDAYQQLMWESTALWLARTHQEPDRGVTEVTLIRRWYDVPAPESGEELPPYNEYEFFVCDVADGGDCA